MEDVDLPMSYRSIEIEKGNPRYAALDPNSGKIYITYESRDLVLILNINNYTVENKISVDRPGEIDINSIENKVYVSAPYGIYEIDGSTNECKLIRNRPQLTSQYFGKDSPSSLKNHIFAVDSTTNKIYVSKYNSQSISVYDGNNSNELVDSISLKSKGNPSFVLVNEILRLLYVKVIVSASVEGGGALIDQILVIGLNDKRIINARSVPSSNTQVGFAFNRTTNTIYVKKVSEKAILKYDEYLIKTLNTTKFEETGFWKRISTDYTYFAEIIVINPMTNKVYVSDSKSKLLYEMDG